MVALNVEVVSQEEYSCAQWNTNLNASETLGTSHGFEHLNFFKEIVNSCFPTFCIDIIIIAHLSSLNYLAKICS